LFQTYKQAEKNLLNEALQKSEEFHLEKAMLDDKMKATDWEATNDEMMEMAARESYLQWLRDSENKQKELFTHSPKTSPPSVSSSSSSSYTSKTAHNKSPVNKNNNITSQNSASSSSASTSNNIAKCSSWNSNIGLATSSSGFNKIYNSMQRLSSSNTAPTSTTSRKSNELVYGRDYLFENEAATARSVGAAEWSLEGVVDDVVDDDGDILAKVLAMSQQEYLESLKQKHQQQKQ
jgi:OTU domain-containing protein 5